MYGTTIRPTMISVGMITPAIHGSKYTSISWRPRKYHGALAGFMVTLGFEGSSSGALSVMDQTIKSAVTRIAATNSMRIRYGQVWTSRSHLGFHGSVLRYSVLARAGSAESLSIRRSFSNAWRNAYQQ